MSSKKHISHITVLWEGCVIAFNTSALQAISPASILAEDIYVVSPHPPPHLHTRTFFFVAGYVAKLHSAVGLYCPTVVYIAILWSLLPYCGLYCHTVVSIAILWSLLPCCGLYCHTVVSIAILWSLVPYCGLVLICVSSIARTGC